MAQDVKSDLNFGDQYSAWVNERHITDTEEDVYVEQIKSLGYAIIEDNHDASDLKFIRKNIDKIYARQVDEIGGEHHLTEIGDANIARQLLAYDDFFLDCATNEKVLGIVRRLMGDYFVLYQQTANLHKPGVVHTTHPWHRDLTFWHYTSSRPLAMTALHVIDDYTDDCALKILPATHLREDFPSNAYVDNNAVKVSAKAGTIIVFNSMMFHRAPYNYSNEVKRSMPHFYTMHLIRQEISLPRILGGKWSHDPFLRRFLGYDIMSQDSVVDWRLEKLSNKRKTLKAH